MAPSPVSVEEMSGRGRAMVACRPIKAGEILLRDAPILVYPNLSAASYAYCFNCFRSLNSDAHFACPSCSLARFCGDPCRSAALSSSHSPWPCRTLLAALLHLHRNNVSNHSSELLAQASFLISAFSLSPSAFSTLMALQGSPASTAPDALFLHSLICSISPEFASFSPGLVSALLAKDRLNAFGLMEPSTSQPGMGIGEKERTVRAYAIYPMASFFNHDCLPNACRFDYVDNAAAGGGNTDIIVRSIHDIEQGREVCLSYFPVTWAYGDRQARLMEDYGFACKCDRCQVESHWKEEDDEDENEDEMMEEVPEKEASEWESMEDENGDFPHAYFFIRYVCEEEGCGGTLAPSTISSNPLMECNACGQFKPLDCQSP